MKKIILGVLVGILSGLLWAYEGGVTYVPVAERCDGTPAGANWLNDRYYTFYYHGKYRLKDRYSFNEVILNDGLDVQPFELHGTAPVLLQGRNGSMYLNQRLTEEVLKGKLFYNRHPFYDGVAVVTPSGETNPVLIDIEGNVIFDGMISSKGYFSEDVVYCVFKDGTSGFINTKGEKTVSVPGEFESRTDIRNYEFHEGLVVLYSKSENKFAVMDTKGNILTTTDKMLDWRFTDRFISFKEKHDDGKLYYGFMDRNLNIKVPAENPTQLGYRVPTYVEWINGKR